MSDKEKLIELLEAAEDAYLDKLREMLLSPERANLVQDAYGFYADHLTANGVTVQKWIPVTERLPEKDGEYLGCYNLANIGQQIIICYFAKNGKRLGEEYRRRKNVWYIYDEDLDCVEYSDLTHWMPLPEPPKDGEV